MDCAERKFASFALIRRRQHIWVRRLLKTL